MARSDSFGACASALWLAPSQTGLVSFRVEKIQRSPGSRACCFSACAGSKTTQGRLAAREITRQTVLPSRLGESVGVPDPILFRSSIARPTDALVYASTETSRRQSQDSGSRWSSLSPFLWGSFIPYNMPVYPGAPPGKIRTAVHGSENCRLPVKSALAAESDSLS